MTPQSPVAGLPRWLFFLPLLGGILTSVPAPCLARDGDSVPSTIYHAAFTPFYEGEYDEALQIYQSEWRGAIKTPGSRWIDSICYHTMIGECHYHMGQLDQALQDGDGFSVLSRFRQQHAQVKHCTSVPRIQLECLPEFFDRRLKIPLDEFWREIKWFM